MKKTILFLAGILALSLVKAQNTDLKARLEKHLYYLASDSLHGREAGSLDGIEARAYILEQWNEIGIEPF